MTALWSVSNHTGEKKQLMPFFLNYTHNETSHILITTFIIAKNMKCLKVERLWGYVPVFALKKKKKT